MDQAARLQPSDPGEANRKWAGADLRLVEEAMLAPLTNGLVTYPVSDRVGKRPDPPAAEPSPQSPLGALTELCMEDMCSAGSRTATTLKAMIGRRKPLSVNSPTGSASMSASTSA
jgi:hypothetical protein